MTAITTSKHKVTAAKDFLENLDDAAHTEARNHYLFISRSRPWPNKPLGTPPTSDVAPPAPEDSVIHEMEARESMIALKRLIRDNSSLVIPKFDWTSGTLYAQYDDRDPELHLHPTPQDISDANLGGYTAGPLYVLTSQFHVFKCLSNNNGSLSTVEPTLPGGAPWTITTSDGYVWKYMLTISSSDVSKFLTDSWIPISKVGAPDVADNGTNQWDVENDAVDGAIDVIHIDNAGDGYKFVQEGKTAAGGGASSMTLEAEAGITDAVESVAGFVGCAIYIISGTGAGQSPNRITAYDNNTRLATVENAWSIIPDNTSIYEIWPTITISGNGSNATAKAIVNTTTQQLEEVIITNVGSGYRAASIAIDGGLDTGGSHSTLHPAVSPLGGHGKDAECELDARYVMAFTKLDPNEPDFPISNDYRQIGILRNVIDYGSTLLSTDTTRVAVKKLNLTGVTAGVGGLFQPDEDFTGIDGSNPDATAKVVDYIPGAVAGEGTLSFWQDRLTDFEDFVVGMTLTGSASGATATVDSIEDEEIEKYEGDLIYIENRRPILRQPNLIEDIKIILEF